jgi:hypothetical protein
MKEKAQQLIDKFYFALPNNGSFTGINNVNDRYKEAKQCALITVDEIIKSTSWQYLVEGLDYWHEIKQEIEKL